MNYQRGVKTMRQMRGQAIAEAAGFMALAIPILIAVLFFLADMGISISYQQKISYLANLCARNYSSMPRAAQAPDEIYMTRYIQKLGSRMGLPPAALSATVTTHSGLAEITVTGTNLPLLRGIPLLPEYVTLQDNFAAPSALSGNQT